METTIFETMSALARETGAINLGQGFPDGDEPPELIEAAARALRDKSNQYAPGAGLAPLREAICGFYDRRQGLTLAPEQVVVTSGATEAIAACILGLVRAGDEAILFQPAYDAYAPLVRRAGGVPISLQLCPPEWCYSMEALEAAISPRTRVLILNDPLNPAGTVASEAELDAIAALCVRHGLLVVCDEVWEEVRFDQRPHRSLMALPGMAERAIKIGSAGKVFGLTGWKTGWLCAAPELASALSRVHQFLTFASPPALQWAVAEGLALPDQWFEGRNRRWAASRRRLADGLTEGGYAVLPNQATWFLCADLARSGIPLSDRAFAERAVRDAGVASIPVSALFEGPGAPTNVVRFCFAKPDDVIDAAVERLAAFRRALL